MYTSSLYLKIYRNVIDTIFQYGLSFFRFNVCATSESILQTYAKSLTRKSFMIHRIYLIYSVIHSTNMDLLHECEMPKFKFINVLYQVGRKKNVVRIY